jgi:chromatin segregation and condensation protein Rec8/ScpA/Scc1 (kleisin family)
MTIEEELEDRAKKLAEAQAEAHRKKMAQLLANRQREAARYVLHPIGEPSPRPEIRPKLEFKARVEFSRAVDGARHEVHVTHADVSGYTAEECFEDLVAQIKNGLIAFPKFDHTLKAKDGKLKTVSHPRQLDQPGNIVQGSERPQANILNFFKK